MYEISGTNYTAGVFQQYSYNEDLLEAASFQSRLCIGLKGTAGASVAMGGLNDYVFLEIPSASASTDPQKYAMVTQLRFGFATLSLSSGEALQLSRFLLSDGRGYSSNDQTTSLHVYQVPGGNKQIIGKVTDINGNTQQLLLIDAIAINTMYHLEIRQFTDKVEFYSRQALIGSITYAEAMRCGYPVQLWALWPNRGKADYRLESWESSYLEVGLAPSSGNVRVNGNPADGDLYFIEEVALETAISGGDAYIADVTDGTFTDPAANDSDYLCIPIESGNAGGFAAILNKSAGGAWSASQLRAVDTVEGLYGSGIAWNVIDNRCPEFAPSRPGYVRVTFDDLYPPPPEPYFESVEVDSGTIRVVLGCQEAVEGYQLSWSLDPLLPDDDHILNSSNGYFVFTIQQPVYLYGRTYNGTRFSGWLPYGSLPPGYTGWIVEYNDPAVTGANYNPYPNLINTHGKVVYYYQNRISPGSYYPSGDPNIHLFTSASGVEMSEYGGQIRTVARLSRTGPDKRIGVIFGADQAFYDDWDGASSKAYIMTVNCEGGFSMDWYARLYKIDAGVVTALAQSADLRAHFPDANLTHTDLIFERIGDTFTLWVEGVSVYSVEDNWLPASADRKYCGLYWVGSGAEAYWSYLDYIEVYRRAATPPTGQVDPGTTIDPILEGNADEPIILDQEVRIATGEVVAPVVTYKVDANGKPLLTVYDATGETEQSSARLRIYTEISEMSYGGTGADLSVGGAIGDTIIAASATAMKRLAGNATATRKFYRSVAAGDPLAATDPAWDTIQAIDLPAHGVTIGKIPKATTASAFGDSIITEVADVSPYLSIAGHILSSYAEAAACVFGALGDQVVIKADYDENSKGSPQINFSFGNAGIQAGIGYRTTGDYRMGFGIALASADAKLHIVGTISNLVTLKVVGPGSPTAHVATILNNAGSGLVIDKDGNARIYGIAADGEPKLSFYQSGTEAAYIFYDDRGASPDRLTFSAPEFIFTPGAVYFGTIYVDHIGEHTANHEIILDNHVRSIKNIFLTDDLTDSWTAGRLECRGATTSDVTIYLHSDGVANPTIYMAKDGQTIMALFYDYSTSLMHIFNASSGLYVTTWDGPNQRFGVVSPTPACTLDVRGTSQLGGASDYSKWDTTGHQTMVGNARPWRDELGDAVSLSRTGAQVSANASESTVDFTTSAGANDYIYKNFQLNHDKDLTASIYAHVHWFQAQNNTPNWALQYRWQINGGAKTTSWTTIKCNTNAFTYTSGTLNQISIAAAITVPVGTTISDIVQFRLVRDNSNASGLFAGADPYTATASVTALDIHFMINSLGSTDEYTK